MPRSSDSSEDEDLSRFRDVVDNSFTQHNFIKQNSISKVVSERYLDKSGHYNDVDVSRDTQRIVGNKLSALIEKKIKFVDEPSKVIRHKVKGGVKLFKGSAGFLTCNERMDIETLEHNEKCKKLQRNRKQAKDHLEIDENEKIQSSVISGEYIMSKKEIKCWKSKRKEKIFVYKTIPNSNVLQSVE